MGQAGLVKKKLADSVVPVNVENVIVMKKVGK